MQSVWVCVLLQFVVTMGSVPIKGFIIIFIIIMILKYYYDYYDYDYDYQDKISNWDTELPTHEYTCQ